MKDHAKRMYIGTLASSGQWSDQEMKTTLGREFNGYTPGNDLKWDAVEPTRGHRNYANGDMVVAFGLQHGMKIRGHTLVWHAQIPKWLNGLSTADLKAALESHITLVLFCFDKGIRSSFINLFIFIFLLLLGTK